MGPHIPQYQVTGHSDSAGIYTAWGVPVCMYKLIIIHTHALCNVQGKAH